MATHCNILAWRTARTALLQGDTGPGPPLKCAGGQSYHSPEAAGLTLRAQQDPAWPREGPLRSPAGQGPLGQLVLPAVRSEDLTHGGGSGPHRHSHLCRCRGLEPGRTSRWEAREHSGWRSCFSRHMLSPGAGAAPGSREDPPGLSPLPLCSS